MIPLTILASDDLRPLRLKEYERLVELGAFEGERVELLRGLILHMSPKGSRHAWVVTELTERLVLALAGRARVKPQLPFAASDDSEPEPDLAVVPIGDYRESHPRQALLVVEVAQSSLAKDRAIKLPIYAEAGVPEVWIVNLEEGLVEVYTDPHGTTWRTKRSLGRGETLILGAFPDVQLAVSDLLP